jgi:hypothetical protein
MTVEELIEQLRALPQTAHVFIVNTSDDDDEWIDSQIDEVIYDLGKVSIRFTA